MNAVSSQVKTHPSVTDVLSAQEAALVLGKRAVHDNVSDRALRLFERVRSAGQHPRISLERAVYFTESFKQSEGQPIVLRWAKALLHTTQNLPICIFEDELIVGRPNTFFGKHGIIYPELDGSIMIDAIAAFRQAHAEGKKDAVIITDEDERIIRDVLAPYWTGRDFTPNFIKALRSRKQEDITATIEDGHISCTLVHLANASYRLGRTLNFDPAKEEVIGDNEANRLLREADRGYRKGFQIPEHI